MDTGSTNTAGASRLGTSEASVRREGSENSNVFHAYLPLH